MPEICIKEKVPFLQELKTQEQVNKHFIPLKHIETRLHDWIFNDNDLLFRGLPFCGKTSLLTYLAYECTRLNPYLQPVRIELPNDVSNEDISIFISKLVNLFN